MIALSIKADLKPLQRAFVDLHAKQAPFAMSLALTALAKGVQAQEQIAVDQTFDTPTRFTENAFRIEAATKLKPVAIVAVKDKTNGQGGQAAYLAPYINGGDRFLGTKKGMLAPVNVPLNQFGNLTKGQLKALLAKPGVFYAKRKTKSGQVIGGIWQRGTPAKVGRGGRILKPAMPLRLLIRFEDTTAAPRHLPFYERAQDYVRRNAAREMDAAMRKALATARR